MKNKKPLLTRYPRRIIYEFKFSLKRIYRTCFDKNFTPIKLDYDWGKMPQRYDILNTIIRKKKVNHYLEIGCCDDDTFGRILCKHKVGVDPERGGNFRGTSDEFFKVNKDVFDLVFIDGLHTKEQVKKDVENALACTTENALIVLHDCLPGYYEAQLVTRETSEWTGDVWKELVRIRTLDDLNAFCLIADFGLGVIQKTDNRNKLHLKKDPYQLTFIDFVENHKEYLNLVPVDKFLNELENESVL